MQPPTHDVHAAVRHACAALANLTERMQPDLGALKPAPSSAWQSEVDRLASSLATDDRLQARIRLSVLFGSASLLIASVDYAKGMAHAIAGGSLYSGHALARCVSEGIGLFRWIVERPTDTRVLLCRALLLLIESHQQEEKRARLSIEAGEADPNGDLEALRDSNADEASRLQAVVHNLGVDERLPQKSDVVADLSRAAGVSGHPTIEYRLGSAFTHLEPLVLFNSLDYERETSEGQHYRTMSVMGLLTPLVIVTTVLRLASQIASGLFEITIGTDPFDDMEAQLLQAFINHGHEQGADLRMS